MFIFIFISPILSHTDNSWLYLKDGTEVKDISYPVPKALDAPSHEFSDNFSPNETIEIIVDPGVLFSDDSGFEVNWKFSSGEEYSGKKILHTFQKIGTFDLKIEFYKNKKLEKTELVRFNVSQNPIPTVKIDLAESINRNQSYSLTLENYPEDSHYKYTWVLPEGTLLNERSPITSFPTTPLPGYIFLRLENQGFYRDFSVRIDSEDHIVVPTPALPAGLIINTEDASNQREIYESTEFKIILIISLFFITIALITLIILMYTKYG